MRVFDNILDLVGSTPLVRLRTGIPENGPHAFVKLEFIGPTGSLKDRMVLYVIRKALANGDLQPGGTVIDNTSGNTGISIAMVASVLGLNAILVTPEKTSKEKVNLIKSYGAKVIITPTDADIDDPKGCYLTARNLAKEHGYFDIDQYHSQDNVEAHYHTMGPEIWEDTEGRITHFVAGIGTGGTFSGAARYLKEKNPEVKAIAVDPEGSVLADYIRERKEVIGHGYKVEGIGSDVITKALHANMVDDVITVSDRDSFNRSRLIAGREGICAGGSSGAVAVAMEQVARGLGPEALVVGVFGDDGIRYLSKFYNDEWLQEQGLREVAEYITES